MVTKMDQKINQCQDRAGRQAWAVVDSRRDFLAFAYHINTNVTRLVSVDLQLETAFTRNNVTGSRSDLCRQTSRTRRRA
jgi:hypothetical protein